MRILGIDPGIGRVGWGVIDEASGKVKAHAYDCFETAKELSLSERLVLVHTHISLLIDTYLPDAVAIESLFFGTNATTAFAVGQARGVVLLAVQQKNLPLASYTPLQVKIAVTGYGRADKKQIGQMVKVLLNLSAVPKPDDTADALAIAMTHAFSRKMKRENAEL